MKEKKKKNKYLLLGIIVLLILNIIFLVGKITYTGKVVTFIEPLCTSNADCLSNQACCKFYGKEAGVCEHPSSCLVIENLTRDTEPKTIESPKELTTIPYIPIIISLIVLIIVLVIYFK